jgi:hypothetical protein
MCAEIGIDRSTIDQWAKVHEDFSLALARAKVLEQRWGNKPRHDLSSHGADGFRTGVAIPYPRCCRRRSRSHST